MGVRHLQIQEGNINPLIHNSQAFLIGYKFFPDLDGYNTMELATYLQRPRTRLEGSASSFHFQFHLAYNKLWKSAYSTNWYGFLGPSLALDYTIGFYPQWDESHLHWANNLSVDLKYILGYILNNGKHLKMDVRLPVAALISRSASHTRDKIDDFSGAGIISNLHSNIEFGSINKYLAIELIPEYQFYRSDSFIISGAYTFNYTQITSSYSRPFKNITHAFVINWYW